MDARFDRGDQFLLPCAAFDLPYAEHRQRRRRDQRRGGKDRAAGARHGAALAI